MTNKKRLFHLLLTFGIGMSYGHAQESINASGGDATSSGGSVAFSIGQTVYAYVGGSNADLTQGVQHPYELFTVGINEEISNMSLKAYPNPTSDYLVLELTHFSNDKMEYQLISIEGKTILNHSITNVKTEINLNTYSKGVYFIKIIKVSKEIKTLKIIKN